MQAIILAAGMGKRLGNLTKDNTKCMVKVNGVTLIERMLEQLATLNLTKIIIVIGFEGDKLKDYVGSQYNGTPIEYIDNPIYDKTNNIYSLSLAKDELLKEDTLLLESDLIFETSVLQKILEDTYPNIALVAKYESWMDGTAVVLDSQNNITNFVPKKAFDFAQTGSYYKTVNIYKFSKDFSASHYVPFLDAYIKAIGYNEYYEQVLRVIALLDKPELKALPLQGEKWYEIDDIQDLDTAEATFAEPENKLSLFEKRYGGYWRFPYLLDFCYLVNPFFPSQRMMNEMKANFETLLTEYPSGMRVNSLLMAKYFGLMADYVCVGNGAAELIKSLMEVLEGNLGVIYPTFEEYPNRKDAQEIVSYLPSDRDYRYSVDDLISYFGDKHIQYLLLINPDNPSGNFIPREDLFKLIAWAKDIHIRLIIDESFVDFSDESTQNTLLEDKVLETYPHLIVVKSISKSYGVPGLRLGVLATSDRELIKKIRQDIPIWNINSFAEFYMQIFNKYEQDYYVGCQNFIKERNRFYTSLQEISYIRVLPSQANYFLCEIQSSYTAKELTTLLLSEFNILVKDCGKKKAFKDRNFIRIAIRSQVDNDRLVDAFKQLAR